MIKKMDLRISLTLLFLILYVPIVVYLKGFEIFTQNFRMMFTMLFGSFIAGSTSEGGGAVAFPVMTLIFDYDPRLARDFSLMIQSFGMTAASLTILYKRLTIERRVFLPVFIGMLLGLPIGLGPGSMIPGEWVKLAYVSIWASFCIPLYQAYFSTRQFSNQLDILGAPQFMSFLLIGFAGGCLSGVSGNGIDILTFSLLVLYYGVNVKVATHTSVLLMAGTSIYAFFLKSMGLFPAEPIAYEWLLACIPVVIIFAPLGALFISRRSQLFITIFLILMILIQFIWAFFIIPVGRLELMLCTGCFLLGILFFATLSFLRKD